MFDEAQDPCYSNSIFATNKITNNTKIKNILSNNKVKRKPVLH